MIQDSLLIYDTITNFYYDTIYVVNSTKVVLPIQNEKELLWQSLTTFTPIFIAVLALIFSAHQYYIQRIHNKLSIRPYLSFFDNRSYKEVKLVIRNNGLGPAILYVHIPLKADTHSGAKRTLFSKIKSV